MYGNFKGKPYRHNIKRDDGLVDFKNITIVVVTKKYP